MNTFETGIYVKEIINQYEAIEIAAKSFNVNLQNRESNSLSIMFANSQSILAAASMISKLLYPNPRSLNKNGERLTGDDELRRKRIVERGKVLREILIEKTDSKTLLKENITVRNSFEHFDERLDDFLYAEREGSRIIVDRNITSHGGIIVDGIEPRHLRRINPDINTISVLDCEVNYQLLVNLISDIKDRAILWQENQINNSTIV